VKCGSLLKEEFEDIKGVIGIHSGFVVVQNMFY
jgi:hypothetical protein